MKVIDNFVNMNIDEFAEWLDEYIVFDDSPWLKWWDKNYCHQCEPEIVSDDDYFGGKMEYSWCELNDNCKFFKDMAEIPSTKEMIKMWLESECE